jgi:hypothetical protein
MVLTAGYSVSQRLACTRPSAVRPLRAASSRAAPALRASQLVVRADQSGGLGGMFNNKGKADKEVRARRPDCCSARVRRRHCRRRRRR